jgi:cytidylate kinase
MYRAVAWMALHDGLALDDEAALGRLATRSELVLDQQTVRVDGHDVTRLIRTADIDAAAARVARIPAVRDALVARQRGYADAGGLVMEGRDIGTAVFPGADVKIFLDASPDERASRRASDEAHGLGGASANLADVADALAARDQSDRTRQSSPLVMADDAVLVDTTGIGLDGVVARVLGIVRKRLEMTA